jgi:type II secretory pathway component HofQ
MDARARGLAGSWCQSGSSPARPLFPSDVKIVLLAGILALAPLAAHAAKTEEEPTVNLDVKDEDIRVILKSMKEQCGIRNLLIDKEVNGKAMFYFRDVPCTTAFDMVARTMGLAYDIEPNSVVDVRTRR